MQTISFFIAGQAVPKGRPRFFNRGKFFGTYTPGKTRMWEQFVQFQAVKHKPKDLPECPIEMQLIFTLPRPKSLPKKVTHHTKKPDADNLAKCIKDALEGIFFKNDSQVFSLCVNKRYAARNEEMGVGITLNYFGDIQIRKATKCKTK